MNATAQCPACGAGTAPDARYCPTCGRALTPGSTANLAGGALLARVRGALVHEFDIAQEIGRGGMAAVYLAHDLQLGRKVALKVMLPELAFADEMPQRFLAEARTAAILDHPNIVPIFRAGESDGVRFFAMRYIDGCSLEQLVRALGQLPIGLACYILAEVAGALDFAHDEGVIHRDVKPGNVMLDRRWGRAIVTDFGIARVADSEHLTRTGMAVGTPAYMSPEQCMGDQPSRASDQYALGIVAYQLLTGAVPYTGSAFVVQTAHLHEPPRSIRDTRPDCPPELEAAVLRMLEKQASHRWPRLSDAIPALLRHTQRSDSENQADLCRIIPIVAPVDTNASVTPASPLPSGTAPAPRAGASEPFALPAFAPPSAYVPPAAEIDETSVDAPPPDADVARESTDDESADAALEPTIGQKLGITPSRLAPVPDAMPAPRRSRSRTWALLGGVATLGVVGFLVLRAVQPDARTPPRAPVAPPAATVEVPPAAPPTGQLPEVGEIVEVPEDPTARSDSLAAAARETATVAATPAVPVRLGIWLPVRARKGDSLWVGDAESLYVRVDSGRARIRVRASGWRSDNPAVISASDGVLRARAIGSATVSATARGVPVRRPFRVVAEPPVQRQNVGVPPPTNTPGRSAVDTTLARAAVDDFVRRLESRPERIVEELPSDASAQTVEYHRALLAWTKTGGSLRVRRSGTPALLADQSPPGVHLAITVVRKQLVGRDQTAYAELHADLVPAGGGVWRLANVSMTKALQAR